VSKYISVSDVALIPLKRRDTFKKVLPSKIFENAAMEKPILLGVEGEAKELIEDYNAGLAFIPEDKNDFLEKLDLIYTDKKQFLAYKDGCRKLASNFDRKKLADRMFEVIKKLLLESNEKIMKIDTALKKNN
jgi:glycosyltransferase involved in cell wall biosynthesis